MFLNCKYYYPDIGNSVMATSCYLNFNFFSVHIVYTYNLKFCFVVIPWKPKQLNKNGNTASLDADILKEL